MSKNHIIFKTVEWVPALCGVAIGIALVQSGFCLELGWWWRAPKASMMSLAPSSGLKWKHPLLLGVKDDLHNSDTNYPWNLPDQGPL